MIIEAYQTWLTEYRPAKRAKSMLWVGYHPGRAMQRMLCQKINEFPSDVLLKMQSGSALEDDPFHAVRGGIITQFPLFNTVWSGYADSGIDSSSSAEDVDGKALSVY